MRARPRLPQRGVSLVEAIVAMAVMAFGMLAVVGLQATLRLNADVAKQRAEAVRIAQEALEDWRDFSTIPTTSGRVAYADIGSAAASTVTGYTTNTAYSLTRTVTAGQGNNAVQVLVSWEDRAGQTQAVSLSSVIAAADPALSGVLSIKPSGTPLRSPMGRNPAIPVAAVDKGELSVFRPPGPGGASIVWAFNNLSGVITSICTSNPNEDLHTFDLDNASCANQPSLLISGFVRFSYATASADAVNPADDQLDLGMLATATAAGFVDGECFVDAVRTPPLKYTYYTCRVPTTAGKWTGQTTLTAPPSPSAAALDLAVTDVCRYTRGLAYDPQPTPLAAYNIDHPAEYRNLARSLQAQNFLVVNQAAACPTAAPAPTLPHQPPL